jgi:hypothetical protein
LMSQHGQLLSGVQKMGHPVPWEFFNSSALWRISLIVGTVVRKCCASSRAHAKEHFWRNAASCGPKVNGGRPVRGVSLQDQLPFVTLLEPDFDLGPAAHISSEYGYEFLMDLFWVLVLHPEIFDEESLPIFLHLSSITYFVNLINAEPFIFFDN